MSETTITLTLREALGAYVRNLRESGQQSVRLSAEAKRAFIALTTPVSKTPATAAAPAQRTAPAPSAPSHSTPTPTPASTRTSSAPVRAPRPEATPLPARFTGAEAPPIEIVGTTRIEKLAHLAEKVKPCQLCPHLAASRTQTVFGVGSPDAKLMFVGEAPGADEDAKGEPFVGAAGQLLTKMIAAMGLSREQVYIANVLKCRPDMPKGSTGNRKPTPAEMHTCLPYLLAQIEIIQPTMLVALGATAVEGLFGPFQQGTSIGRLRGKFMDFRGTPVMPTYHPSYLLRNQSIAEKRKVWEDLLLSMEKLELPISDKQRNYFLSKS